MENKNIKIVIPEDVEYIINTLDNNGYEVYIVGGCVRDSLLGRVPKDWDITTNAKPKQVIELFKKGGFNVIETGLKHGTVTVIINHIGYEITTYRIDGDYSDGRHPDEVIFTNSLKEDLSRRDFTINAMAYNTKEGLIDYFEGQRDLEYEELCCVGEAEDRFKEDGLRMLRAVRFASQLGFSIYRSIFYAFEDNIQLLANISKERIREEFNKILISDNPREGIEILTDYSFMDYISPEIYKTSEFNQQNPYHCFNVFDHIMKSIEVSPKDLNIRLALYFHDIAKPKCFTVENGQGHFYNHAFESAIIAENRMKELKYDNKTIEKVVAIVRYHDYPLEAKKSSIKKFINKIGEDNFMDWYEIRIADVLAQNLKYAKDRLEKVFNIKRLYLEIIKEKECFTIKDLNINGNDLINIGIKQGKEIGNILSNLLELVIEDEKLNTKENLIKIIKSHYQQNKENDEA